jgi:hypothetical protein
MVLCPRFHPRVPPFTDAASRSVAAITRLAFGKVVYRPEPLVAYVQHDKNTYGVRPLNAKQWLKYVFRYRGPEIANFAKVAQNRANILDAAVNLDPAWRARAVDSQLYYKKLTCFWLERSRLYASRRLFGRIRAFCALLFKSGYTEKWGLGVKALFLDTFIGIPLGPLFRKETDLCDF